MFSELPLFPPQASSVAAEVDALFFFLVAVSVFFSVLIAGSLIYFALRFYRREGGPPPERIHGSLALEALWTAIPLVIVCVIFFWSASIYFHLSRPPDDAMPLNVVAKRWMWKLQHMNGNREINELHVPVGRSVRLNMTSEDVIHSFFVPAFRIKADVVPGRYTTAWFKATRSGEYHLFCTEYCGTEHSRMIGRVIVMEPRDFETWLGGGTAEGSLASAGEKLFRNLGCVTCHLPGEPTTEARGPDMRALYGSEVRLDGGGRVIADEAYIRESIVEPAAKLVEGYRPLMPTFRGLINEEGILQIIEYLKAQKAESDAIDGSGAAPSPRAPTTPAAPSHSDAPGEDSTT